jgi:hypothetical protein
MRLIFLTFEPSSIAYPKKQAVPFLIVLEYDIWKTYYFIF